MSHVEWMPTSPPGGASTCTASVRVRSEVLALHGEIIENRRFFHTIPELAFQEHKTAAKVASLLRGYGIEEVFEGVGKTGVVALIYGGAGAGPCCMLR